MPGRATGLTSGVPVGTGSAVPVPPTELPVPTVPRLAVAAGTVPGTVVKTVTVGVPAVGVARVTGPDVAGLLETGTLVTGALLTETLVTGALLTGALLTRALVAGALLTWTLVAGEVAGRVGFAVVAGRLVAGRVVVRTDGFAVVLDRGFVVVLAGVGAAAPDGRSTRRRCPAPGAADGWAAAVPSVTVTVVVTGTSGPTGALPAPPAPAAVRVEGAVPAADEPDVAEPDGAGLDVVGREAAAEPAGDEVSEAVDTVVRGPIVATAGDEEARPGPGAVFEADEAIGSTEAAADGHGGNCWEVSLVMTLRASVRVPTAIPALTWARAT